MKTTPIRYLFILFSLFGLNLHSQTIWHEVARDSTFANITDMAFSYSDTGFIVPQQLLTTDGGKSWSGIGLGEMYCQCTRRVNFLDQEFGYSFGHSRNKVDLFYTPLFITNNGGLTWKHIQLPSIGGEVDFINSNVGFCALDDYNFRQDGLGINMTKDGGMSWAEVGRILPSFFEGNKFSGLFALSLAFYDEGHGLLSVFYHDADPDDNGGYPAHIRLCSTEDSGKSWTEVKLNANYQFYELTPLGKNKWVGKDYSGVTYFSTDNGRSWMNHLIDSRTSSILYVDRNSRLYAFLWDSVNINNSSIFYSTDYGISGSETSYILYPPDTANIDIEAPVIMSLGRNNVKYALSFGELKYDVGLGHRYFGRIFRSDSITNNVSQFEGVHFVIQPNPAKDHLYLTLTEGRNEGVIEVFDALGRQVSKEIIPANTNSYTLDIRRYASGAYYVRYRNMTARFVKF